MFNYENCDCKHCDKEKQRILNKYTPINSEEQIVLEDYRIDNRCDLMLGVCAIIAGLAVVLMGLSNLPVGIIAPTLCNILLTFYICMAVTRFGQQLTLTNSLIAYRMKKLLELAK